MKAIRAAMILVIFALLIGGWQHTVEAQTVCLVSSVSTIDAEVLEAVRTTLESSIIPASDCFAITNVTSYSENRLMVSIAGINLDGAGLQDWNIQDHGDWFSLIALQRYISGELIGALQGTEAFSQMIEDFPLEESIRDYLAHGGTTDSGEYLPEEEMEEYASLPFMNGTSAIYGTLGVHAHGDTGWVAVDFVSYPGSGMAPNAAYSCVGGIITNICRDGTQMGLKIGNFYYLHLVNNPNFTEGFFVVDHQNLGSMVTGNFDDDCGGASQLATHWHLHLAFPGSRTELKLENWVLNLSTEIWNYGMVTRSTGQLIGPADWSGLLPPPSPGTPPGEDPGTPGATATPGGPSAPPSPGSGNSSTNFWSFLTSGIRNITAAIASMFPEHDAEMGLAASISEYAVLPIKIVYVTGVMNYKLAFVLISFIPFLEILRAIYGVYMLIKRAIPVVG